MKKFYFLFNLLITMVLLVPLAAKSQDCSTLTATYTTYESRCAATGAIKIVASGGSGDYKYKMEGPSNTNYTSTDSITGLSAGTYTLYINDITTNCTTIINTVVVEGTYQDPRFVLIKQDVTCDNGNNGSITVDGVLNGRPPFMYTIVAPSPMGIGTSNSAGIFPNLMAGNYSIQMTDSCGGIQTRQITVGNYSWWIDTYSFAKTGCDEAEGFIKVVDSRGNISTVGGIPGFTYGIVRTPGDTLWSATSSFAFTLNGHTTFDVIVKDNCGLIKKVTVTVYRQPNVAGSVNMFNYRCNTFSAEIIVTNFFSPTFCIYDSANVEISCNATGIFTDLPYGNYCIKAHDACTDTTITRCFTGTPPPISVGQNVLITDKTCTTFTATIIGQSGLTNPRFCLYDSTDVEITCNATGIFTDLPYGTYCIKIKDGCRDTLITRCFTVMPPVPTLPAVIVPSYITCTDFGIIIAGDSTTNPRYCLYDSNGGVITCNDTGIFDSIPLGHYCVTMHDECTDTTITRCFDVDPPTVRNDMSINIRNKTCTKFDVTASSNNFINPYYCLYDSADVLIACDSSGRFTNLPYGSYCIKARIQCPDTLLTTCFTVGPPIPSVNTNISTGHLTCTTFNATVSGLTNLTTPSFCLYDSADVLIICNTTGVFNNLPYGRYCIKITTGCYDTTITRCFSKYPAPVNLSGSAGRSCTLGKARFSLSVGGANLPIYIVIYRPDGSILMDTTVNNTNVNIDNIPGILSSERYRIIATDNCGRQDSTTIGATGSYFNHTPVVEPKCPGSSWANGSGNIRISVSTNLGSLSVRIVKKNGVPYSPTISPDVVTGNTYIFNDLGPGTYILASSENYCNKTFNDTITILPYQFPNLTRSSAYQCDVNGFSVSAVALGGVPPFSYSIIGSIPSTPSIIAGPQSSPIFNINNGATYSLIRLRALDACGNATLGDASILPLAITGIDATLNCFSRPTTLSVDEIYNATYSWYRKDSPTATDSVYLGNTSSYFIPDVTLAEIGFYYCYINVNSGCINRVYMYHLTGLCQLVLPVQLHEFTGITTNADNILSWKVSNEIKVAHYILERKNNSGNFSPIKNVQLQPNIGTIQRYTHTDNGAPEGANFYRLKLVDVDGSFKYSNTVLLNNKKNNAVFSIYPNPVTDMLTIDFKVTKQHKYSVALFNGLNQLITSIKFTADGSNKLQLPRHSSIKKGMYILRITDEETQENFAEKVIYL